MPIMGRLSKSMQERMLNWPCNEYQDTPWTPMTKPLSQSKVALVSTAGFHVREDRPFVGGDTSYRIIPRTTNPANIIQSHTSIGFDRTETFRDINITYPVNRLEELVVRGEIGSLSDDYYSFMGALSDVSQLVDHFGPQLAKDLKNKSVDVVLLVPT